MRETIAERALVDQLRAGDGAAVSDLADRYSSKIFRLAFRYLKNHEDAEEITQDVLLKVYQKIDGFRGDAALSSWVYRITFNMAMSRLRRSKADMTAERLDSLPTPIDPDVPGRSSRDEVPDWSSLADDQLLRAEMRRKLIGALRQLPLIYRIPVLLRDVQGFSTEEAAAVVRVKSQTLKSRLHRGRLVLRDQLEDFANGLAMRPNA